MCEDAQECTPLTAAEANKLAMERKRVRARNKGGSQEHEKERLDEANA